MARYAATLLVIATENHIRTGIREALTSTGFELVFESNDYLMAREIPGQVKFSLLTSAEILIDLKYSKSEASLVIIVKNEQLPLNKDNHCQTVFDRLKQTLIDYDQWTVTLKT